LFIAKPRVWFSLLKRNRVDRKYWHKAFFISLITLLVYPLQWIQEWLYRRKFRQVDFEKNPPIFVLGHWRSGTTHLHYILHQDPQFGTLSNYQAFLFTVAQLSKTWLKWMLSPLMPSTRPQDNTSIDMNKPAEEEQPFCTISTRTGMHSWHFPKNSTYFKKYNLFEGITPKEKKLWQRDYLHCLRNIAVFNNEKRLVLKNPHNTSRVKELLELFPNAKFIFIHRDPIDVFLSTRHLYKKMVSTQYLQPASQEEVDAMIFDYYKKIVRKYLNERHLIPEGNLIELSYHQLKEQPEQEVEKIYRELGLPNYTQAKPHITRYLQSTKKYKANSYKPIDENLRRKIYKEMYFEELDELFIDYSDLANIDELQVMETTNK
jgi:hypothetical protein